MAPHCLWLFLSLPLKILGSWEQEPLYGEDIQQILAEIYVWTVAILMLI